MIPERVQCFVCLTGMTTYRDTVAPVVPFLVRLVKARGGVQRLLNIGYKMHQPHKIVDLSELAVPPGNHLERLRGDRKGQHSIRINDQYRICFRWEAGDVYEVEIADYH